MLGATIMTTTTTTTTNKQGENWHKSARCNNTNNNNNDVQGENWHKSARYNNNNNNDNKQVRNCTGLKPNTEKTETMSYHPGAIRGRCSMEGYNRRHKGTRKTYYKRKGIGWNLPKMIIPKDGWSMIQESSMQCSIFDRCRFNFFFFSSLVSYPTHIQRLDQNKRQQTRRDSLIQYIIKVQTSWKIS